MQVSVADGVIAREKKKEEGALCHLTPNKAAAEVSCDEESPTSPEAIPKRSARNTAYMVFLRGTQAITRSGAGRTLRDSRRKGQTDKVCLEPPAGMPVHIILAYAADRETGGTPTSKSDTELRGYGIRVVSGSI